MFKQALENSSLLSILKKYKMAFYNLKGRLGTIYESSLIHRLVEISREKIKISFEHCFLNRIAKKDYGDNRLILDNSRIAGKLLTIYCEAVPVIMDYSRRSRLKASGTAILQGLCVFPLRVTSVILVTALSVNLFSSVLVNKEISALNLLLKLLLLFAGIGGLYSEADYKSVRETSLLLRLINNYSCKIQK